jgi:hypothetical protein
VVGCFVVRDGCVPIVYAPKVALIWWTDYIDNVSEDALLSGLTFQGDQYPVDAVGELGLVYLVRFGCRGWSANDEHITQDDVGLCTLRVPRQQQGLPARVAGRLGM